MDFKNMGVAILGAFGIAISFDQFVAGALLAVIASHFGREVFKDKVSGTYYYGVALALILAIVVAMAPHLIPMELPPQLKMAAAGFFSFPILRLLKKKGEENAE